jgi:PhnB protein
MTVTPYLIVDDAQTAIDFYQNALGAAEHVRLADPSGKVMHAEIRLGNVSIMLADEFPELGYKSPKTLGGSAVSMLLYVDDVDASFAAAIALGATVMMPIADQFDGERRGTLKDPFGHVWLISTKQEDISIDELKRRFTAMLNQEATS